MLVNPHKSLSDTRLLQIIAGAFVDPFTGELIPMGSGGGSWGSITGTLADQTDLQAGLDSKQANDGTLTALAGLTIVPDSLTIGTGTDAFTQTTFGANTFPAKASTGALGSKPITDFGLSLVNSATAAAARTTLGLGTLATQNGTFSGTSSGTNTGDQTIALTGDVTGAGTGPTLPTTTTIAAGVVTYAKIQNLSGNNLLLGRSTAGVGSVQEITVGSGLSLSAGTLSSTDIGGTVTNFSAGDLAPIFTTTEATTTTTPALSFSLSSAAAHTFLGNNTGGLAAPAYVQPAFTDLSGAVVSTQMPALTGDVTTVAGFVATTIGSGKVTLAMMASLAGKSVIGKGGAGAGVPTAITAVTASHVLRMADDASGIAWGTVDIGGITDKAVTYPKIQDVTATDKVLGRSSSGAGVVEEIACTAAGRALIDDADAAAQRTTLGGTSVGKSFFTLTNPGGSGVTFPQISDINVVSALNASAFRAAIGAGTGSGTVTAVTGTAPIVSSGGTAPAISITAATTGAAGSMSAADKTKLDAITGTNTGDQIVPSNTPGVATQFFSAYNSTTGAFTQTQPTFTDLAAHPTTIGGYGITDFNSLGDARWQPLDGTLTAFAALTIPAATSSLTVGSAADTFSQVSFAANTFPGRSSSGNLVAKTITDFAFNLLTSVTNAAARTTLGVTIGTNVQAWDTDLDTWAAITRASGFDTFVATPSSANFFALITGETGSGAVVGAVSPALTGVPSAPTAAVNDNSTQIATTAFVLGQVGTATPIIAGTGAVGTSLLYARQDHVHPAQTLTTLGGTTVGQSFFTLANPGGSGVTFPQISNTNVVSALDAAAFRTAIGAGTGAGTVTAVSIATANGVSGTSSGGATPALTIALGAITPTTVNGLSFTALPDFTIGTAGGPTTSTKTWVSNGDTNGVLYFLGTNLATQSWVNPHTAGRCTFIRSSDGDSPNDANISAMCDRAISYITTNNSVPEFFGVDLGSGRTLKVADYTLQNGSTVNFLNAPYNWRLEGSNNVGTPFGVTQYNAATWATIDTHATDGSISQSSGAWARFSPGNTTAYRFLRVISTGNNQAGNPSLQIGEMEFYGEFAYTAGVKTLTVSADANVSGTNTGDQTITLTGNVTGSGTGSFTTTIANSAVTLAKMADMATASFIGRNTAGLGAPEILDITTTKTMLGIGGPYQPLDADLTAIAAFTGTEEHFYYRYGASVWDVVKVSGGLEFKGGVLRQITYRTGARAADNTKASASTLDLTGLDGPTIEVTGTTNISAITLADGEQRGLIFSGAGLTLTNGSSLVLPGGKDLTTTANGFALIIGGAAGLVTLTDYQTAERYSTQTFQQIFMSDNGDIGFPNAGGAFSIGKNPTGIGTTYMIFGSGAHPLIKKDGLGNNAAALSIDNLSGGTSKQFDFPNYSGTFSMIDGTESLTNKKLGSLTTNGFVKTSGGDGTLSVDTVSYEPALGNPGTSGFVLSSTTGGVRSWIAAGTGTVTNFSAGDLSPLFTTSEATTTTTPALTFSLSTAAANTFFGNGTGSTAAPTFMSAATAQTALGLVIGTNVQAYDANLTTWAGITPGTGVGTFLATPSSANLLAAVTDETGTGPLVFGTTPTLTTPVINGIPTGTGVDTAATADTLVLRDATGVIAATSGYFDLISASVVVQDAVTTAASGSAITLDASSATSQYVTGTNTIQNVNLPDASTLSRGHSYFFRNLQTGTGTVVVKTTAPATLVTLSPGTFAIITCVNPAGGTGIASWSYTYSGGIYTTGTKATFPSTSCTVARTDAAQTFTGVQTMTSPALTTPAITGLATGSGVASAATASTLVARDGSGHIFGVNLSGSGDLISTTAGKGLQLQSGTGARAGNATLVAGTITVTNTTVDSTKDIVLITRKTSGGTIGMALTYTLSNATSFTINSDNILDTSTLSYMLVRIN